MTDTTRQPTGGRRLFTRSEPYAPTHYQCHDAARLLAESAAGFDPPVTAVVGIANGGTRPATVIADCLNVPLYNVSARHNRTDALWQQATGNVSVILPDTLPDRFDGTVLLVDDIAGSGATFTAVAHALSQRFGSSAVPKTLALCRNAGCTEGPDGWIWDVDNWVVFPWETTHAGDTRQLPVPKKVATP
ncbi:phosphoribosyltransferase [Kitasatospora sp. MBT63]|uniref:phosphoribosyltransferase n=1 Tax=Kitasatospora sp. MBT63 TaxID=1444768 RepID=UPI00068B7739|nr:phosphoribosyltransferase family protein [Kitasatospora sp. MBT63]